MQELSTNCLKLGTELHEEFKDAKVVMVLGNGYALSAGRAGRRRHLITLMPQVAELCKKFLNRAVTLVGNGEGMQTTM